MKAAERILREGIVEDYKVDKVKGDFSHEVWDKKSPHFLDFKYFVEDGVDSKKIGLVTLSKVTHGLRLTQNNMLYPPADLKDALPSLTSPFNIPIKPAHRRIDGSKEVEPIGRALSGSWVDNPKISDRLTYQQIKDAMSFKAKDSVMTSLMKSLRKNKALEDSFEGAGWVLVRGLVTDTEAIEKILDGRYLTVSVEMQPEDLIDSICGMSYKRGEVDWDMGDEVDGELAFAVPYGLKYSGYAYVTHPADTYAKSVYHQKVEGEALEKYMDSFKTTMVLTDCFKSYSEEDITDSDMMASVESYSSMKSNSEEMTSEDLYSKLSDDEKELADALTTLVDKVGPLDKASGIWTGYESSIENENAQIGVKCCNCALYVGNGKCKILSHYVEPKAYCRFAVIPDGMVSKSSSSEMEDSQVNSFSKENKMTEDQKKEVYDLIDSYLSSKLQQQTIADNKTEELISDLSSTEKLIASVKSLISSNFNISLDENIPTEILNDLIQNLTINDAVWTTAYVNDLPDSAFFYIEKGGEKDEEGKTKPRSLRHLPYKDSDGKVDLPHLRNAIARAPQVSGLASDKVKAIQSKAQRMLARLQGADKDTMDSVDLSDIELEDFELEDEESFTPTPGMAAAAKRALEWRSEFKRGGTPVGVARARDLMNRKSLSHSTVMRMKSFFARHEVDKKAEGFNQGEEGFPSAGRIAWDLWGGEAGKSWAYARAARIERMRSEDSKRDQEWVLDLFEEHYSVEDSYVSDDIEDAKEIKVGDFVAYAVDKAPDPTTYAKGKVSKVDRSGKVSLSGTNETKEATEKDPVATLDVYMEVDDETSEDAETLVDSSKVKKTDRKVLKNFSELRKIMAPPVWSKKETPPLRPMGDSEIEEADRSETLSEKVKQHNEKYGDAEGKRVNLKMLKAVYNRGIGAYKTNPSSVRPNVASAEQWAFARVNGFLHAVGTGSFKRKAFDTDLLPKGHKLSSKS